MCRNWDPAQPNTYFKKQNIQTAHVAQLKKTKAQPNQEMGRRQTLSKENIQIANKHMKICSTSLLEICKSKLQWGTTSHQSEWPSVKKSTNDKCWRGCAEKGTPLLLVGM